MIAGAVVAEDKPQPAREQNMRMQKRRMMRDVRGPLAGRDFGKLSDGRRTKIYTLKGAGGLRVDVSDYGGRIVRVYAPDRHGNLADVTLGWNTAGEYEKYGFSMGTLIGRFGNRIADGKFKIDGKEYQLPINEKTETRNCNLHSGPEGWDSKIWKVRPRPRMTRGGQALELTYVSPDGDMGFPGTVTCKVVYAVSPANVLSIEYTATTDKPTIINLTHHGYWNMAGEASGNVLNQELQIFADEYSQVTAGLIPTKNIPVKGTPFDFTSPCVIGSRQQAMLADEATKPMDSWYDHNFVLRGKVGEMKKAAIMKDPVSGRKMEIWTTEPCMQMYGAQNMTADKGLPAKQAGAKYLQYQGFALETQHAPDSPNHPEFPSTVLRPGETFSSRTEYRFTAE
jgi:aldose 1-epimerase